MKFWDREKEVEYLKRYIQSEPAGGYTHLGSRGERRRRAFKKHRALKILERGEIYTILLERKLVEHPVEDEIPRRYPVKDTAKRRVYEKLTCPDL